MEREYEKINIVPIPQLLKEDRFHAIDKIKTVGSTFMAAVGLIPGKYANAWFVIYRLKLTNLPYRVQNESKRPKLYSTTYDGFS